MATQLRPCKLLSGRGRTVLKLVWQSVHLQTSKYTPLITISPATVPRPIVVEDRDVIVKVTGSTVCGSDLHLLHGTVVEMRKGDILGHEFCGIVDEMGSAVTGLKKGDRVVASFQIACGDCMYCKKKLSSQCEKTNSNTIEHGMYGGNTVSSSSNNEAGSPVQRCLTAYAISHLLQNLV